MENLYEGLLPIKSDNHRSRSKRSKDRDCDKKAKKNNIRLSSIDRDYLDNVESEQEGEFFCLGEQELLDNLDKLNFKLDESEDQSKCPPPKSSKLRKFERKIEAAAGKDDVEYYPVDSFNQFNRDLKLFLKDEGDCFETAPETPEIRRYIHLIGNLYQLKTYSVGRGDSKRIVLEKTERSGLLVNTRQLDKLIEQGNKAIKWNNGELSGSKYSNKSKKCPFDKKDKVSAKPTEGSIVGANSAPIREDNVGNQMLQKMGWSPGMGLGRESSGPISHVKAVVKTKRTGLV